LETSSIKYVLKIIEKHSGFEAPEWVDIFNTYAFFSLHQSGRRSKYFVWCSEGNPIEAIVHITEQSNSHFKSPIRGTYAGIQLRLPNIQLLEKVIEDLEFELHKLNALSLSLAMRPFSHDNTFASLYFNTLLRFGYTISAHELNYTVQIDSSSLVSRMQRNNQKRWRKCDREGFTIREESDYDGYKLAYTTIAENRASKGYPISMSFEAVWEMKKLFPEKVFFFTCNAHNTTVAAAICIALNTKVLYVFYWGDKPGFEQYSPIAYLAAGIYDFAFKNSFSQLDAGISTEGGIPNPGLMRFKSALGFDPSLKLTFTKKLFYEEFGRI
jgi:hypothetical protein